MKTFKASKKYYIFQLSIVLLAFTITSVCMYSDPFDWKAIFSYLFSLGAVGAVVETICDKLEIYPTKIVLIHSFKKTIIPKENIVKVTWEKASPASVLLKNGVWMSIPAHGTTGIGLCNTIRAWMKRP